MDNMMKAAGFSSPIKTKVSTDFADIVIISDNPTEFLGVCESIKGSGYSCLNLPKNDISFKQAELICYIYSDYGAVEYNTIQLVELIKKYKSRVIVFIPEKCQMHPGAHEYYSRECGGTIELKQMADMISLRMRDECANADLMYDLYLMDGCTAEEAANFISKRRISREERDKLVRKLFSK